MESAGEGLKPTVSSSSVRVTSKSVLDPYQIELLNFTRFCGFKIDPEVFLIIHELLKHGVDPTALYEMLKEVSLMAEKST